MALPEVTLAINYRPYFCTACERPAVASGMLTDISGALLQLGRSTAFAHFRQAEMSKCPPPPVWVVGT